MFKPLIVSVGMPRAGSGWYYNLTHDLIVASGGQDAHQIRKRFFLKPILTEVNNNIGAFTVKRLLPVIIPAWLGNEYVIKAHAGPTPLVKLFIKQEKMKVTYIYRDPRDALLSAFEYGRRKREWGRSGAFSDLKTIEDAISFMAEYLLIAESWLAFPEVLHTSYENLLLNYDNEAERLLAYLNLDLNNDKVVNVIKKYNPLRGSRNQTGTHFVKGKIGRYEEVFSNRQKQICLDKFGLFLERMGYLVP